MTIILSHAETTKNTKGFPNKKVKKNKRTDVFSELNCDVQTNRCCDCYKFLLLEEFNNFIRFV